MQICSGVVGREPHGNAVGGRQTAHPLEHRADHAGTGRSRARHDRPGSAIPVLNERGGRVSPAAVHTDQRPDRPTVGSADAGDVEEATTLSRRKNRLWAEAPARAVPALGQRRILTARLDVGDGEAHRHTHLGVGTARSQNDVVGARSRRRRDVPPSRRRSPGRRSEHETRTDDRRRERRDEHKARHVPAAVTVFCRTTPRCNHQESHFSMVSPRTLKVWDTAKCPFCALPSARLLSVEAEGEDQAEDQAEDEDQDIPGIDRLLALTDGVVAIALTLLVLQLQVPVTSALTTNPDSAAALWRRARPGRFRADELPGLVPRHRSILDGAPPHPPRHARPQRRIGLAQLQLPPRPHAHALHVGPDRSIWHEPAGHHTLRAEPGRHQPEHAVDLPLRRPPQSH